jgi:molecular chaperone GrpE
MTEKKEEQKQEPIAETKAEPAAGGAAPKAEQSAETKHHHKKDEQIRQLQEKLTAVVKEKEELFARLQRLSADYANFQKRSSRQTAEAVCFEREKIIKSLLPALDDFERTIKNAAAAPENRDAIINGIKIIYGHMLDILKACDVEQIKAVGQKFDPFLHEAISRIADNNKEDGVILEETQRGYKLGGKVLRPSRVVVNKLQTDVPEDANSQPDETTDVE